MRKINKALCMFVAMTTSYCVNFVNGLADAFAAGFSAYSCYSSMTTTRSATMGCPWGDGSAACTSRAKVAFSQLHPGATVNNCYTGTSYVGGNALASTRSAVCYGTNPYDYVSRSSFSATNVYGTTVYCRSTVTNVNGVKNTASTVMGLTCNSYSAYYSCTNTSGTATAYKGCSSCLPCPVATDPYTGATVYKVAGDLQNGPGSCYLKNPTGSDNSGNYMYSGTCWHE